MLSNHAIYALEVFERATFNEYLPCSPRNPTNVVQPFPTRDFVGSIAMSEHIASATLLQRVLCASHPAPSLRGLPGLFTTFVEPEISCTVTFSHPPRLQAVRPPATTSIRPPQHDQYQNNTEFGSTFVEIGSLAVMTLKNKPWLCRATKE